METIWAHANSLIPIRHWNVIQLTLRFCYCTKTGHAIEFTLFFPIRKWVICLLTSYSARFISQYACAVSTIRKYRHWNEYWIIAFANGNQFREQCKVDEIQMHVCSWASFSFQAAQINEILEWNRYWNENDIEMKMNISCRTYRIWANKKNT